MTLTDTLAVASALVEAPSPSGDEGPVLRVAESLLREAGLHVVRQDVGGPGRFNLFAALGTPRAVLTTHLDTVPGVIPLRVDGDTLHGRGACDAKGVAAAMIGAASDLRARGIRDFGVLFVVGEETTSDGAIAANGLLADGAVGWHPEAGLFGEPTENRWVSAHTGVLIATLVAHGRAAHSSCMEEGVSAVDALLEALERIRWHGWPDDRLLGPTRLNIGRIEGGTAANVVPALARAEVMIRSGSDPAELQSAVRELAGRLEVTVTCASPPVRFECVGENAHPVAFSTDAAFLPALGRRGLLGPGSIRVAHTDTEHVTRGDLERARASYVCWVEHQLGRRPA
jgi:acetylornithine deacetylase